MVTGLHTHQHKVTGNDVNGLKDRAALDKPVQKFFHEQHSLIKELVANGYLAHQSGKWWEGSWKDGGFTHGMTHGDPKKNGRHGDAGLKIGRQGLGEVTEFIDMAVEKKQPFFVWYAPFLPHTPHNPPPRLLKKYESKNRSQDVAKYLAMIDWFDETCGELLGHISKQGLDQNTLVVYVCDNGWKARSQSDIKIPESWSFAFAPRSKGSPFENGIRTPIMFKFPGQIVSEFADDLASAVDLYPTILSVCGLAVKPGLPGINLLDEQARKKRQQVFGASYSIHNMVVGKPAATRQYRWVITKRWKYLLRDHGVDTTGYKKVHRWDSVPERLYDLTKDPHEKFNLNGQHPEVCEELKSRLQNWLGD